MNKIFEFILIIRLGCLVHDNLFLNLDHATITCILNLDGENNNIIWIF